MSTEPGQVRARSSSPEAERMRLYRKRRREAAISMVLLDLFAQKLYR